LKINYAVTCYPWDGVGTGNIPDNTPSNGNLRVQRDSDGNLDLIPYSAHDGDEIFTLVGTAPSTASIANTTMRAFIDTVVIAGTSLSFTALFGTGDDVALPTTLKKDGVTFVINPVATWKPAS